MLNRNSTKPKRNNETHDKSILKDIAHHRYTIIDQDRTTAEVTCKFCDLK
jgi:hypothetical protein